jgi:PAS domain S-box-containing protein
MPRYVFEEQPRRHSSSHDSGQSVPREEVSSVLSAIATGESELSRRLWDKVLLENTDDVVFVLSLKGLFLYLSPSSKRVLEYDALELMGTALSSVCHPSDIVPVTRELKDSTASQAVDVVFRIRRKNSGYMWFEGNGALHTEQGKGRKSIVLVGRERPVYALSKNDIQESGGINDNELWTKLSTSGMFLFVSNAVRQLLDKTPDELVGTTMTALMRPETKREFLRILELARTGKMASTKHEMINKRGQVLQAFSTVYPGDAPEGKKPTFLIVQTRLLKYTKGTTITAHRAIGMPEIKREVSSTSNASGSPMPTSMHTNPKDNHPANPTRNPMMRNDSLVAPDSFTSTPGVAATIAGVHGLKLGRQDVALASELNLFTELKTTRSTSWQFELRQMEKQNRLLAEELQTLLAAKKKRKRRKGAGSVEKECANCRTRTTPEWRRGPSGNRDLCNSCGLRFAKQQGRISPRTTTSARSAHSAGSGGGNKRNSSGTLLNEVDTMSPEEEEKGIDSILAETGHGFDSAGDAHISKSNKNGSTMRRFSSGGSLATQLEENEDAEDAEVERDEAE